MTVAVCLMGPTAVGKTEIAISLCKRFPLDIISVDSALVYRGMDIGTAKPDRATLARTPHRLIDIRDPEQHYSAGDFVRDATAAIEEISLSGRVPFLVGGTMMYFRALTEGIATLPSADPEIRAEIDVEAADHGWPALHAQLAAIDPQSAQKIEPNDRQRIQRALEVYRISGRTLSAWQSEAAAPAAGIDYVKFALTIEPRARLHARIERRLDDMFARGFVEEVAALRKRPGLTAGHPSMRAVGYRQVWAHLAGEYSRDLARDKALAATRQLAKRQLTWLRGDSGVRVFDALESGTTAAISREMAEILGAKSR